MKPRRRRPVRIALPPDARWGALPVLGMLLALAACNDEGPVRGTPVPNATPDTAVTGTPPDLERAGFAVSFAWFGWDSDGRVDGFEWRISDDGRDGRVDRGDTLGLPWHATTATDSTFIVPADLDSLPVDVDDPRQGIADYRFWQTHTLFVRAVDDGGARDPTPASVSFTATTLAPTIHIDYPAIFNITSCLAAPRVPTFGWSGEDPDGATGAPTAVRYLLWEVPACMTRSEFERDDPLARAPQSAWSAWIAYDAGNAQARRATLARQELQSNLLFAVQARDAAGAVTPTLEWNVNVRHIVVSSSSAPRLTITDQYLGNFSFTAPFEYRSFEIVAGQPLEFRWDADAGGYGGTIEAFRFGFDVQDVGDPNDPGWAVPWGLDEHHRRAPARSFGQGTPNFIVAVRDNSGTITRGIFQFDVIQVARRDQQRSLLLVQDWPHSIASADIQRERAWDERWNALLLGHVVGFDALQDVLDTTDDPNSFTFRRFNDYKSVVYLHKGADANTAFRKLLAPAGASAANTRYNWLEVYQAQVGNILFCGPRAMAGTVGEPSLGWSYPIIFNVSQPAPLGFGQIRTGDGIIVNVGTLRYAYTSWCLEAVDIIRPEPGQIYDEDLGYESQQRTRDCDAIGRALVAAEFLDRFPSARGEVGDLRPSAERGAQFAEVVAAYQFNREEFYDVNVTDREVTLHLRDCQLPMFRLRARRDEGLVPHPVSDCVPRHRTVSVLDGAPIGIVSTARTATKPLAGSEDFLWGFHPLAFDPDDLRSALLWICRERWGLATR